MRCPPAGLGRESDDRASIEVNGVGRREVVGQDHDVVRDLGKIVVRDSLQIRLHAIGDVFDVRFALAQVRVIEALESRLQLFLHLGQRPLGVDLLRFDFLNDFVRE